MTRASEGLKSLILGALLLGGAAVAGSPVILHVNHMVAMGLRPLALRWGWLNVVWVVGGLPVTLLVLVIGIAAWPPLRRSWRAIALGALLGSVIEVLLKHYVALPTPPAVPAPAVWNHLSAMLNVGPRDADRVLHWLYPRAHHVTGPRLFPGSYPSGHVYRTTFVAGAFRSGRRRWPALLIAAVVAFMTVATGGHWAWDTVGGVLLAFSMLSLVGALRRGA